MGAIAREFSNVHIQSTARFSDRAPRKQVRLDFRASLWGITKPSIRLVSSLSRGAGNLWCVITDQEGRRRDKAFLAQYYRDPARPLTPSQEFAKRHLRGSAALDAR